jgi:hypothetical protein
MVERNGLAPKSASHCLVILHSLMQGDAPQLSRLNRCMVVIPPSALSPLIIRSKELCLPCALPCQGDMMDVLLMSTSMAVLIYMSMQLYRVYAFAYYHMGDYQTMMDMMS